MAEPGRWDAAIAEFSAAILRAKNSTESAKMARAWLVPLLTAAEKVTAEFSNVEHEPDSVSNLRKRVGTWMMK